jgi:hypothetical protein
MKKCLVAAGKSIVMALVQPPQAPHELNPPQAFANEMSTDNAEQSVLLEKPENEKLYQLLVPPPRREILLTSAKIAFLLIFAIFYLTFCVIVRYRNVPSGSGVVGLLFLQCE